MQAVNSRSIASLSMPLPTNKNLPGPTWLPAFSAIGRSSKTSPTLKYRNELTISELKKWSHLSLTLITCTSQVERRLPLQGLRIILCIVGCWWTHLTPISKCLDTSSFDQRRSGFPPRSLSWCNAIKWSRLCGETIRASYAYSHCFVRYQRLSEVWLPKSKHSGPSGCILSIIFLLVCSLD